MINAAEQVSNLPSNMLNITNQPLELVLPIVGGIFGLILVFALFDWARIAFLHRQSLQQAERLIGHIA